MLFAVKEGENSIHMMYLVKYSYYNANLFHFKNVNDHLRQPTLYTLDKRRAPESRDTKK